MSTVQKIWLEPEENRPIFFENITDINLDYLLWEVTKLCNLNCIHCRADSSPQNKSGILFTREVIDNVLIDAKKMGLKMLSLTGGEPTLFKDYKYILQKAKSLNIKIRLQTNSLLLSETDMDWLQENKIDSVGIGMDGATSATHDFVRNKKGAFDIAIEKIKGLVKRGISVHVEYTIMRDNVNETIPCIELMDSLGVDTFLTRAAIYSGRSEPGKAEIEISPEKYRDILTDIWDLQTKKELNILYNSQDPLWWLIKKEKQKLPNYNVVVNELNNISAMLCDGNCLSTGSGCTMGANLAYIKADGHVTFCSFIDDPELTLESVVNKRFFDIWNERGNVIRNIVNRELKGKCGSCDDKFFCGGCRARANAVGNSYYGDDPYCWKPETS